MIKPVKAYKRSKRKEQIINTMLILHQHENQQEATSYGLAKRLNIEPSMHLINLLNEMVEEGDLDVQYRPNPGRYPTRFYLLAESRLITKKYSRRHISVKSRGQAVGQLEMFS